MTSDVNGLRDEVHIRVTGDEETAGRLGEALAAALNGPRTPQTPQLPGRPDNDAPRKDWVEYVVALGADRTYVTGTTRHYSSEAGRHLAEPGLTREQLIPLANRLGG